MNAFGFVRSIEVHIEVAFIFWCLLQLPNAIFVFDTKAAVTSRFWKSIVHIDRTTTLFVRRKSEHSRTRERERERKESGEFRDFAIT